MKCKDCKILKTDGQKYQCPANPFLEDLDMYSEHLGCRGPEWYPKYVADQLDTLAENIRRLDDILAELYGFLQSYRHADGYTKLVADELQSVYDRFASKQEYMIKEANRLREEADRIKGVNNGKTEEIHS